MFFPSHPLFNVPKTQEERQGEKHSALKVRGETLGASRIGLMPPTVVPALLGGTTTLKNQLQTA